MSIKMRKNSDSVAVKRFFEDADPDMLRESEEGERENLTNLANWATQRVEAISKRLTELKPSITTDEKAKAEYYKWIDELIKLCQGGFIGLGLTQYDKVWVAKAIDCLGKLYDDLIVRVTKRFVGERKDQTDYEDVLSYARQLVGRLITGDTPWAVRLYSNEPEVTAETKAALSDLRAYKQKIVERKSFDELIGILTAMGLHERDVEIAKQTLDYGSETFGEWAERPTLSKNDWVLSMLNAQLRRRQATIRHNLPLTSQRKTELRLEIEYLKNLVTDNKSLEAYIQRNKNAVDQNYGIYLKEAHRTDRFILYKGANFTAYMELYLRRRLIDLYRRKELAQPMTRLDDVPEPGYQQEMGSDIDDVLDKNNLGLSTNELQVLRLRLQGFQPVEIATKLKISKGRVSQLMSAVKKKATKKGLSPR